jgi:putative phosphoribosyl transferase
VDDPVFADRRHAGRQLARSLSDLVGEDVVVLALARGGVPVGLELAFHLEADLDVLVVQKLGAPGQPELALGAVTADGNVVVNQRIVDALRIDVRQLRAKAHGMADDLARRAALFRAGEPPQPVEGRTVVVVDDGIATGVTLRAALDVVRAAHPGQLVAAVPVAPPGACAALRAMADRVVCLYRPAQFGAVGQWYRDFTQLTDDEVVRLLAELPVRREAGG